MRRYHPQRMQSHFWQTPRVASPYNWAVVEHHEDGLTRTVQATRMTYGEACKLAYDLNQRLAPTERQVATVPYDELTRRDED